MFRGRRNDDDEQNDKPADRRDPLRDRGRDPFPRRADNEPGARRPGLLGGLDDDDDDMSVYRPYGGATRDRDPSPARRSPVPATRDDADGARNSWQRRGREADDAPKDKDSGGGRFSFGFGRKGDDTPAKPTGRYSKGRAQQDMRRGSSRDAGKKKDDGDSGGGRFGFLRGKKDDKDDQPSRSKPFVGSTRFGTGTDRDRDRLGGAPGSGSPFRDRSADTSRPGSPYGDRDRPGDASRFGSSYGDRDRPGSAGSSLRDRSTGTDTDSRFGSRDRTLGGSSTSQFGSRDRPSRGGGALPPRSESQQRTYGARGGSGSMVGLGRDADKKDKQKDDKSGGGRFGFLRGKKDDKPAPKKDKKEGRSLFGRGGKPDDEGAPPRGSRGSPTQRMAGPGAAAAGTALSGRSASRARDEGRRPSAGRSRDAGPPARASRQSRASVDARSAARARPLPGQKEKGALTLHQGLDFDRKLDLTGVLLVAFALVMFFSVIPSISMGLLPEPKSGLTFALNDIASQLFGWGKIAIPVAAFAVGVWLMRESFNESGLELDYFRIVGMLLLFTGALAILHMIELFDNTQPSVEAFRPYSYALAVEEGGGGGWIGHQIYVFLLSQLLDFGTVTVLVAWIVVGLMLTFDLTVVEIWTYIAGLFGFVHFTRGSRAEQRAARRVMKADQAPVARPGQDPQQLMLEQASAGVAATGGVTSRPFAGAAARASAPAGTDDVTERPGPRINRRGPLADAGTGTGSDAASDEPQEELQPQGTRPGSESAENARTPSRRRLPHMRRSESENNVDGAPASTAVEAALAGKQDAGESGPGKRRFGFLHRSRPAESAATPADKPADAAATAASDQSGDATPGEPERKARGTAPFARKTSDDTGEGDLPAIPLPARTNAADSAASEDSATAPRRRFGFRRQGENEGAPEAKAGDKAAPDSAKSAAQDAPPDDEPQRGGLFGRLRRTRQEPGAQPASEPAAPASAPDRAPSRAPKHAPDAAKADNQAGVEKAADENKKDALPRAVFSSTFARSSDRDSAPDSRVESLRRDQPVTGDAPPERARRVPAFGSAPDTAPADDSARDAKSSDDSAKPDTAQRARFGRPDRDPARDNAPDPAPDRTRDTVREMAARNSAPDSARDKRDDDDQPADRSRGPGLVEIAGAAALLNRRENRESPDTDAPRAERSAPVSDRPRPERFVRPEAAADTAAPRAHPPVTDRAAPPAAARPGDERMPGPRPAPDTDAPRPSWLGGRDAAPRPPDDAAPGIMNEPHAPQADPAPATPPAASDKPAADSTPDRADERPARPAGVVKAGAIPAARASKPAESAQTPAAPQQDAPSATTDEPDSGAAIPAKTAAPPELAQPVAVRRDADSTQRAPAKPDAGTTTQRVENATQPAEPAERAGRSAPPIRRRSLEGRGPSAIPAERRDPEPAASAAKGANAPERRAGHGPLPPEEWRVPDYRTLLKKGNEQRINDEILLDKARVIEDTLASFGAPGKVVEVNPGPVITQFGVEPDYLIGRGGKKTRVKVNQIARLDADLALALAARTIRIEAPVPGKGFVGIEVPNDEVSLVSLYDIMESPEFTRIDSKLRIALGLAVDGAPVAADLTAMPHLLIAGTTGSGKSVCVNAIITSLLLQNTPKDVQFIMVDPKRVELTGYNGIPHLVAPVVVELERIVGVLQWVQREMEERYRKFAAIAARNITDYNRKIEDPDSHMPYYIVVVDELADLMMLAPDETERLLARLAQMARATGIHLIISTQRPSVDIITGLIKANFPARIAFAVASSVDSRVILDQPGAEKLLGRGDMLFQSPDAAAPLRMQGVFVSDNEINTITRYWKGLMLDQADAAERDTLASPRSDIKFNHVTGRHDTPDDGNQGARRRSSRPAQRPLWTEASDDGGGDERDELYQEAVELVQRLNKASISLLQRRLRIGYTRAARLIDIMEQEGIVGPSQEGSKPREVIKHKIESGDD